MVRKRDAFFVNNGSFQLLMALLITQKLGMKKENAVLFLNMLDRSDKALLDKLSEHFTLADNAEMTASYDTVFLFTTVFPSREVFCTLRCDRRVLVYEGLTTCYTEKWASCFLAWSPRDFDEIWVPSPELVENPGASWYVKLDAAGYLTNPNHLRDFVAAANPIFRYDPALGTMEASYSTVFFDCDFERFNPPIFSHRAHRLLTVLCAAAFHNKIMVKLHPNESCDYHFEELDLCAMKGKVPNELIYANLLLNQPEGGGDGGRKVYLLYNSSAPVNCYSLFGHDDFDLICLVDLLNRYGFGAEETLIAPSYTKKVLLRLQEISNIRVYFPQDVEDLFAIAGDIR